MTNDGTFASRILGCFLEPRFECTSPARPGAPSLPARCFKLQHSESLVELGGHMSRDADFYAANSASPYGSNGSDAPGQTEKERPSSRASPNVMCQPFNNSAMPLVTSSSTMGGPDVGSEFYRSVVYDVRFIWLLAYGRHVDVYAKAARLLPPGAVFLSRYIVLQYLATWPTYVLPTYARPALVNSSVQALSLIGEERTEVSLVSTATP